MPAPARVQPGSQPASHSPPLLPKPLWSAQTRVPLLKLRVPSPAILKDEGTWWSLMRSTPAMQFLLAWAEWRHASLAPFLASAGDPESQERVSLVKCPFSGWTRAVEGVPAKEPLESCSPPTPEKHSSVFPVNWGCALWAGREDRNAPRGNWGLLREGNRCWSVKKKSNVFFSLTPTPFRI